MFEQLCLRISSLFPRSFVKKIESMLVYAGMEKFSPRVYLGLVVFFSLGLGLTSLFWSYYLYQKNIYITTLATFLTVIATLFLFYLILSLNADNRARKIEAVLPDVLQIISSNIRAGMTTENAIWSAARPEFGPLETEIKRVSADTFGGQPLTQALSQMAQRVNSSVLDRAIKLVNESLYLGGEMSRLLQEVAADIRESQTLKKEIATSTMMYSIFIVFAGVVASPLLFSVSVYYAEINENLLTKQSSRGPANATIPIGAAGKGGFALGVQKQTNAFSITSKDVAFFAYAAIFITTFFAALILALIREGNALRGVKIAPIFVIIGFFVFNTTHALLTTAFKNILT